MEKRRREDVPLNAPNTEGNVWPIQACPAFEPRIDTPKGLRQCWYCRYADFHLISLVHLRLAYVTGRKKYRDKAQISNYIIV